MLIVIPATESRNLDGIISVYNQFTPEWDRLCLDNEVFSIGWTGEMHDYFSSKCRLNHDRGNEQITAGLTCSRCQERGGKNDDGLSAPKFSVHTKAYEEAGEFRIATSLCRKLGVGYANPDTISGDDTLSEVTRRFTRDPGWFPNTPENVVPAITHATFVLSDGLPVPGTEIPLINIPVDATGECYLSRLLPNSHQMPAIKAFQENATAPVDNSNELSEFGLHSIGELASDDDDGNSIEGEELDVLPFSGENPGKRLPPLVPAGANVAAKRAAASIDGLWPVSAKEKQRRDGKPTTPPPINGCVCHGDSHNAPFYSDLVSVSVPIIQMGMVIRQSRLYNQRKSGFDFIDRHGFYGPLVRKFRVGMEGMPMQLRGTPEEYFGYIGENGFIYTLDKRTDRLLILAALTPAAANKPMAWCSPFLDSMLKLASCQPGGRLTRRQKSQLEWLAAFSPSTVAFATVCNYWAMNGGLPDGDIVGPFFSKILEFYGSFAKVPEKRTIPSANADIVASANKRSTNLLTSLSFANVAARPVGGNDRSPSKSHCRSLFARCSKMMSHPRTGLYNVGTLGANTGVHLCVLDGSLYPPELIEYARVGKENQMWRALKEQFGRAPTDDECNQLLANLAEEVNSTEAEAEAGSCEPNRINKKSDAQIIGQSLFGLRKEGRRKIVVQYPPGGRGAARPLAPMFTSDDTEEDLDSIIGEDPVSVIGDENQKRAAEERYVTVTLRNDKSPLALMILEHILIDWPVEKLGPAMESIMPALARYAAQANGVSIDGRPLNTLENPQAVSLLTRQGLQEQRNLSRAFAVAPSPPGQRLRGGGSVAGNQSDHCQLDSVTKTIPPPNIAEAELIVVPGAFSTAPPTYAPTLLQREAKCNNSYHIEPVSLINNLLRLKGAVGALGLNKTFTKRDVVVRKLDNARSQRSGSFFYADCPYFSRKFSLPDNELVAKFIALNQFGGEVVRDPSIQGDRIVFPTKGLASNWYLFTAFLMGAQECPLFTAKFCRDKFGNSIDQTAVIIKQVCFKAAANKPILCYLVKVNSRIHVALIPTERCVGKVGKIRYIDFSVVTPKI